MSGIIYLSTLFQDLRKAQPGVLWMVTCYHYETRTRTVYYTDSNGNRKSRIETYQEKVVTYTGAEVKLTIGCIPLYMYIVACR